MGSLLCIVLFTGEASKGSYFRYLVAPNTLLVRDNGTVNLVEASDNLQGSVYMAPELESNPNQYFSDTAYEKVSIGLKTLLFFTKTGK